LKIEDRGSRIEDRRSKIEKYRSILKRDPRFNEVPIVDTAESFQRLGQVVLALVLLGLWCVWWLGAVNWQKTWPVLAQGAWVPVVLFLFLSAGVWSRIAPSNCTCLGLVTIPNFYWQLGSVSALAAAALFCGWLQGRFGWTPAEIDLEPPTETHGHDQGHSH
jgi:hypothetical protein